MANGTEILNIASAKKYPFRFAQVFFIYYMIFSVVGFYLEKFWAYYIHLGTSEPFPQPTLQTLIPMASPYGIGAVAVILISWPLIKKQTNPLLILILNIVITGTVEYISALTLVVLHGHNSFWDYSNFPFNIRGYVSLLSAFLFGIAATFFLYFIYPAMEKLTRNLKGLFINIIFWIFLLAYIFDLVYSYWFKMIVNFNY